MDEPGQVREDTQVTVVAAADAPTILAILENSSLSIEEKAAARCVLTAAAGMYEALEALDGMSWLDEDAWDNEHLEEAKTVARKSLNVARAFWGRLVQQPT